jgi:hypothetical protein
MQEITMSDLNEKVNENDISVNLEDGTATYNLRHHGQISGTYMGVFRFLCSLNPIQYIEADKDYRELLGKNAEFASTHADTVAYALAQLRQRVIDAPSFWNEKGSRYGGSNLKDHEILEIILEAAVKSEVKYRQELHKKHEEAISKIKAALDKRKLSEEKEDLE